MVVDFYSWSHVVRRVLNHPYVLDFYKRCMHIPTFP